MDASTKTKHKRVKLPLPHQIDGENFKELTTKDYLNILASSRMSKGELAHLSRFFTNLSKRANKYGIKIGVTCNSGNCRLIYYDKKKSKLDSKKLTKFMKDSYANLHGVNFLLFVGLNSDNGLNSYSEIFDSDYSKSEASVREELGDASNLKIYFYDKNKNAGNSSKGAMTTERYYFSALIATKRFYELLIQKDKVVKVFKEEKKPIVKVVPPKQKPKLDKTTYRSITVVRRTASYTKNDKTNADLIKRKKLESLLLLNAKDNHAIKQAVKSLSSMLPRVFNEKESKTLDINQKAISDVKNYDAYLKKLGGEKPVLSNEEFDYVKKKRGDLKIALLQKLVYRSLSAEDKKYFDKLNVDGIPGIRFIMASQMYVYNNLIKIPNGQLSSAQMNYVNNARIFLDKLRSFYINSVSQSHLIRSTAYYLFREPAPKLYEFTLKRLERGKVRFSNLPTDAKNYFKEDSVKAEIREFQEGLGIYEIDSKFGKRTNGAYLSSNIAFKVSYNSEKNVVQLPKTQNEYLIDGRKIDITSKTGILSIEGFVYDSKSIDEVSSIEMNRLYSKRTRSKSKYHNIVNVSLNGIRMTGAKIEDELKKMNVDLKNKIISYNGKEYEIDPKLVRKLKKANKLHKQDLISSAKLQVFLSSNGYYNGSIDGIYGKNTMKAIASHIRDSFVTQAKGGDVDSAQKSLNALKSFISINYGDSAVGRRMIVKLNKIHTSYSSQVYASD